MCAIVLYSVTSPTIGFLVVFVYLSEKVNEKIAVVMYCENFWQSQLHLFRGGYKLFSTNSGQGVILSCKADFKRHMYNV